MLWRKDCVYIEHHITDINFTITSTKSYILVVTLSINNNTKFLGILNQGFTKKTLSWNNYRSKITNQLKNNNLDRMVDLAFSNNLNSLFVLLFKNDDNDPMRDLFSLVETKYFKPLMYNQFTTYLLT